MSIYRVEQQLVVILPNVYIIFTRSDVGIKYLEDTCNVSKRTLLERTSPSASKTLVENKALPNGDIISTNIV